MAEASGAQAAYLQSVIAKNNATLAENLKAITQCEAEVKKASKQLEFLRSRITELQTANGQISSGNVLLGQLVYRLQAPK